MARTDYVLCSRINRLLGNIVQIRAKQLHPLNVIPLVQLLIDGMGGISRASHGEKQDILAGSLFKSQSNGDASWVSSDSRRKL